MASIPVYEKSYSDDITSVKIKNLMTNQETQEELDNSAVAGGLVYLDGLTECTPYSFTFYYHTFERGSITAYTAVDSSGTNMVDAPWSIFVALDGTIGNVALHPAYSEANNGVFDFTQEYGDMMPVEIGADPRILGEMGVNGEKVTFIYFGVSTKESTKRITFRNIKFEGGGLAHLVDVSAETAIETLTFIDCEFSGYTGAIVSNSGQIESIVCERCLLNGEPIVAANLCE